jgi:hypothetical protein
MAEFTSSGLRGAAKVALREAMSTMKSLKRAPPMTPFESAGLRGAAKVAWRDAEKTMKALRALARKSPVAKSQKRKRKNKKV